MMNTLPTWDLTALYPTAEAWDRDCANLPALADNVASFQGHLAESAETILHAFEAIDTYSRCSEKLYAFAMHKSDEDTRDSVNRARVGKIESLHAELSAKLNWFEPELIAIPEEDLKRFRESETLSRYRRSLNEIIRTRQHTLSQAEERIIGTFSEVLSASGAIFSTLNDSDLSFGKLRDSSGKLRELTHGSYHLFMEDPDREVRKHAFRKLYTTYKKYRNTFSAIMDTTVKQHVAEARTRHFSSALQSALDSDNIPEAVYSNLIDTIHSRLSHLHRYMKLREKVLRLDAIDMWDVYTPLLPQCRLAFSWDEAVALAEKALAPLGKDYLKTFKTAFTQRWIDAPERKGKRSGAYSGGCYDSFPYILMNFQGTLNDVFTLVHESGHSMHSFYSNKTQPFHEASYKIFVAEVASTTNEILLAEYMLSQTADAEVRAYLLTHLAEEIRLTIYRQTMFAEFEWWMHQQVENHVTLTADLLEQHYYDLNNSYHGFKADKLIALEWSRIPHFHYNFYVYKYATGMSAAIKLANDILHGGPAALKKYIGFLKAGNSKDVLDIMADAGVDLRSPKPVADALDYFGTIIDRLEAVLLAPPASR